MTMSDAKELLARLDQKLAVIVGEIERSEVYRVVVDPATPTPRVLAVVRNILLETYSYGADVTEAVSTAIGRLARRPDLVPPLLAHLGEEVHHAEMALRGFVELGGDAAAARARPLSPAAFAVGAVCLRVARDGDPLGYLGYVYLFEATTAVVAPRFHQALVGRGRPVPFVEVHAVEEARHAADVRGQIDRAVRATPGSAAAIEAGFDYLAAVYPLPVWAPALGEGQ
jgi:hypothetical protein